MTLTIPDRKLKDKVKVCSQWLGKDMLIRKELHFLIGKLNFVHKAVPKSRIFVNRLLNLLRDGGDSTVIVLHQDAKRDLVWLNSFLEYHDGTATFVY